MINSTSNGNKIIEITKTIVNYRFDLLGFMY